MRVSLRAGAPLRGWRLVRAGLLAVALVIAPFGVQAQQVGSASSGRVAAYDLPAQDLDVALNAYIKISGAQVFYETALTAGRRSAQVRGRLAPAAALRVLLAGTGLVARRVDDDAFSVIAATAPDAADAPVTPFAQGSHFVTALQASVLKALCASPQTRPGDYRIAFELWVGPAGKVQSSVLVGSTGDAVRDTALIAALQNVAVGAAPPPDMPQPIIMAIAPRSPQETGDCVGLPSGGAR